MRSIALTSFLLAVGHVAISQLTLTPQIGLERSKTTINLNDLNSFSPLGSQFSPQVAMRLDYKFKKGHGPFVGISTSRSVVAFDFTNPETALTSYTAVRENLQLRLEGGYQLNTKPFYFKGSSSQRKTSSAETSQKSSCAEKMKQLQSSPYKRSCSGYRSGHHGEYALKQKTEQKTGCGQKSNSTRQMLVKRTSIPYIRFQPLAGLAFIPSPMQNGIAAKTYNYSYNAGNWNTALITGLGLEFGRGKTKTFQVNIQYLKGLGNLGENELTTVVGNKTTSTTFSSRTTSWSVTAGIPVSLSKKQHASQKPSFYKENKKENCEKMKKNYEQIKTRCRTII